MRWRAIRSPLLRGILALSVPGSGIALPEASLAAFSLPARLTVVTDDNYPPFLFRNEDGRLQGILKDKWELWSRATGVPVVVEGTAWTVAQARIRSATADVIDPQHFHRSATDAHRAELHVVDESFADGHRRHGGRTGVRALGSGRRPCDVCPEGGDEGEREASR